MSVKKEHDWPVLKARAKNCVLVTRWLESFLRERVSMDVESQMLVLALYGFNQWFRIAEESSAAQSIILTDEQVQRLSDCRRIGFYGLRYLSKHARSTGKRRYFMIPKAHLLDEALRRSIRTKISFGSVWVFRQEDTMGLAAQIAKRVHSSCVSNRTLDRWLSTILSGGY